ncbi:MAG: hypothetical protein O7C03_05895 [Gammaproteobacteria bacterium]|nr:hypothetical protein [Pseudomonadota bacterium]MCZ6537120.1 hypothetical protein [Gammaproteobacteria bacterium]MCZ6687747.1 hypothetical protein [Gammaproteobacteria bacterium]MCZ6762515.1 hypothetical protein [Gammaproteobacteria bacterium]MCZ6879533.1 hypothetical protein [Gammaproteobacteria bacterium]
MKRLALALLVFLAGCSDPGSPEQQVRDTILQAELAAEARDMGAIRDLVHDEYQDRSGRDRRMLLNQVRLYLMARQSLELLVKVNDIKFTANDFAEVDVTAAGLGLRAGMEGLGLTADGDHYQIDLARDDDGNWLLIGARPL